MDSTLETPVDVVVIGAGPAGTATAALCRKAGLSVRVLEAQAFPRFVIGESLLPHCMDVLEEAGLLEAARAMGFQEKLGALFLRGEERCDFLFAEQLTKGWSWTWQVPRADFDHALAREVERRGVPFHFKHAVEAVDLAGPQKLLRVVDDAGRRREVRGRFVVDASGYGRVLPRLLDLDRPSSLPPRGALFTHVAEPTRPPGPEGNRIWIVLHPLGFWLWIIPFSNGTTSVGAVGSPELFERFPGTPEAALKAILAADPLARARFASPAFTFEPRALKGYAASVKRLWGDGFCLVGNATEFLDPIFSSGVSLALESAHRASGLLVRQLAGEAVDWDRDYAAPMSRGVDVFRTFVTRWYDGTVPAILFSKEQDPKLRAQICSVLAGYVWDEKNPMVRDHARRIEALGQRVRARSAG